MLVKVSCNHFKLLSKTTGKSILTLVNEEYKPNMTKEEVYVPLHSGKFLGQAPVMIETIPSYISVRKLSKLTQGEKDSKKAKQEAQRIVNEDKQQAKNNSKQSGKNKLKSLGLTDDEIVALVGE